jgi:hypothetical protein
MDKDRIAEIIMLALCALSLSIVPCAILYIATSSR